VQRFGGALNLDVHFHCLVPDGVFVEEKQGIRFSPCPARPRTTSGCWAHRPTSRKLLRPRREATDCGTRDPGALAAAQAGSVGSLRGGHLMGPEEGTDCVRGRILVTRRRAPPRERSRGSRAPLRVQRPSADRTEVLVLEPCELLRRLAALIPETPAPCRERTSGTAGGASHNPSLERKAHPAEQCAVCVRPAQFT